MEEHTSPESTNVAPAPVATATRVSRSNLAIPGAIVIAAALIAGAIFMSGTKNTAPVNVQGGIDGAQNNQVTGEPVVAPVTKDDHIRGNPNAPIVIIEYSDYDCPFCRVFHDTMAKVMSKYGKDGKVAWVYRHFPLVQLHPDAPKMAIASECVTELEGNEAFWVFTDKLNESRKMEFTPEGNLKSVEPTNITRLTEFAVAAGADKTKFELCLNSGKYDEKIAADVEAAAKTGARGTPYSIVMVGEQQGVINGAQPFEVVDKIIANLITQLGGATAQ